MKTKKTQTLIRLALVLAIIVVVSIISVRLFGRLDLTAQKVYTLSDASKKLVGGLDDRLTIKAYFTEDLPAPYNASRRAVLDILNEYRAYGGHNLQFEFINPAGEKGEEEARQQGIPAVEVQVVKEDKFEVKRAYLGLVLLYEDRKETLPVIQNLGSLEFDLSSAIKRLVNRTKKRIGYTTGHQEANLPELRQAYQNLMQQYDVVPVALDNVTPVPQDLAALLVIAPNAPFADSSLAQIDRYVMGGGKVAFLLNKVRADLQQQRYGQPLDLGIEALLEQYGVRINADLVRDVQCANISVMQQQQGYTFQSAVPFRYIPNVSNFSRGSVVVKDLQSVFFYFVSSLDTTAAAAKGVRAEVLARTSKRSGRQTGMFIIDPFQQFTQDQFAESGIPLAAAVEGSFTSFFAGRPLAGSQTKSPETRIIVVGDGDFMRDDFAGNRGNMALFANIVDYLADDAGLITIRSKNLAVAPLDPVSDGVKQSLKYFMLLAPPLLVIAYGLLRWRRRVNFKKMMEAQLKG